MPEYLYQIKGKDADGRWAWPPLFSDRITADTTKKAREVLELEYGLKLPGLLRVNSDKQHLLLTLIDMTDKPYLRARFDAKICRQCLQEYTDNQKYQVNAGGPSGFCSSDCSLAFTQAAGISYDVNFDFNGIHEAVIYKITNKTTGKCYIGKTTQAFTLRWYQHFYQGTLNKFYLAISQYGIADWTFEVIEVIDISKGVIGDEKNRLILARETHWIKYYNSIHDGFNSVIPVKGTDSLIDENQQKLF